MSGMKEAAYNTAVSGEIAKRQVKIEALKLDENSQKKLSADLEKCMQYMDSAIIYVSNGYDAFCENYQSLQSEKTKKEYLDAQELIFKVRKYISNAQTNIQENIKQIHKNMDTLEAEIKDLQRLLK